MIPNVVKGHTFSGLLAYLVSVDNDPERVKAEHRNVHEAPHIVAGHESVTAWWPDREVLSAEDARQIAGILDEPRRAHGTEMDNGHVWHASLSLHADEGRIGDEKWAAIARDFVESMGFADDAKADCRWVAIHHGPSAAGNDHIHLAVSLVREDGTKASTWLDWPRSQQVARDLENRHGLLRLESVGRGRSTPGLSRAELERTERDRLPEPERRYLARAVRGVAAQSENEVQFVRGMRSGGLYVEPWYAKGSRGQDVAGYKVAFPGSVVLGGGKLGHDLSLPRLREAHGWVQDAETVATWRQGQVPGPSPRRAPRPAVDWEARRGDVQGLTEYLRTIPLDDQRQWAAVAHELSGVLAAGSLAVEGRQPGPLAAASETLARSAEVKRSRSAPRPEGMPPLLRLAQALGRGPGHAPGDTAAQWLSAGLAVIAASKAVYEAHVAVQDAQRAEAMHRAVVVQATEMVAQMKAVTAQPARPVPVAARPVHRAPQQQDPSRGR